MSQVLEESIQDRGFASVTMFLTVSPRQEWLNELHMEWVYSGALSPQSFSTSVIVPEFAIVAGPKSAAVTKRLLVNWGRLSSSSRSVSPEDLEVPSPNSLHVIRSQLKARGLKRINVTKQRRKF
jgi:hypothetical protein